MLSRVHFTSKNQEWETPQELFEKLHAEFDFTIDLAAHSGNAKLDRYYNWEQDSLKQNWVGERGFLNPPYGRSVYKWVEKCKRTQTLNKVNPDARSVFAPTPIIVALLYARTSTRWFHDWVYPFAEIRFLRGRLKFELGGEVGDAAPFPSMIAIWR